MNAQARFLDDVLSFREELKAQEKVIKRLRQRLDAIIDDYFETEDLDPDDVEIA